ncbi:MULTISPECIES: NAD(P)H-quinone oxidoreductase subunit F [Leptolyngbya]|jgi:NAD(P)H-quinone oxidoreductase subunit 5|uniref:NAD(P)H-quinone oxidoreductase subunit F n=2 Tax=Leptolyngbya boryana TaxID=1184 RepID=A0A1Z4JPN8_LEPBY|nr:MULTISPECIES: NAD(P)H-quinone oxidoreductase subunit F [Leptolyngbya]BAY58608.1 NAD(P)H-quinone oxidoreductase subunit F [Leptolyngbya boryana NIES-2135]MBD1858840.1 NAD(P)H-quinone oxidoreductase subunit F [Leptolyngbya sp. FACHB-1624]MBD2370717.1 NAD(P)H-quinone oxidoreductase subunit F [Leptolyngbya sp. FACHB-161]MBD2377130.1 NAD(P)H-quinone oxidoreductase subunit F [Leptolyngbya sp. FACHB-238]MBD2401573.1 NAD(P)H-quinone oxidoreductase subunit F [Leptolyngbya sp. FACHB-239]
MAHPLLQSIWLIPCYALLGAILSALWFPGITRRTGPRPSGYLNGLMSFASFLHAAFALPATWNQPPQEILIPWLDVAGLNLTIPIEISTLSVGAIVLVTGINLLAQTYAFGYMEMDWGWARFFSLLAFFEAGMTALVLCNSLFFSYFILEILTLATYLLVGVWFNQSLVVTGARDAFLTKRLGDLFLLMGVVALLPLAGTWDFNELAEWAKTAQVDPKVITLVGLALIAGPMGKCAQFPLHLWLDEAMEGPVPASILRNSVVVATGAWVLFKLEPVLALSPTVLGVTIFIGAVSAIGGSLIAIAQIDIKRTQSYLVTAYMGLVFIAVGTQQPDAALLLVLSHALASALLIMGSGAVVWNSITQDVTQLGGLWSRRPVSGLSFLIGLAGLVAFPPLGGFWALLKITTGIWETQPWLVGVVLLVNAFAAFGVTRVFCLVFKGESKQMAQRSPEIHYWMALPMIVLMGFILHLPLIMQALNLLPSWAEVNTDLALLLIWSTVTGIAASAIVYLNKNIAKPVVLPWKGVQDLLAYDFYTPNLYRSTVVFLVALVSQITSWFDKYLVDGGLNLFGVLTLISGRNLRYSNSGQSQFYMLTILFGIALISVLLSLPFLSQVSISLFPQSATDIVMNVQR